MLASFGFLEWFFIALLVGLTGGAGLVGLYIVSSLRKNPSR